MKKVIGMLVLLFTVALTCSGTFSPDEEMALAKSVLDKYEYNVNGGRYEDWYASLSDDLQKLVSDKAFLMKEARANPILAYMEINLITPKDYFTYVVRFEREDGRYVMEGYMLDTKHMELVILGKQKGHFKRKTFVFIYQREKWLLKEVEDT